MQIQTRRKKDKSKSLILWQLLNNNLLQRHVNQGVSSITLCFTKPLETKLISYGGSGSYRMNQTKYSVS